MFTQYRKWFRLLPVFTILAAADAVVGRAADPKIAFVVTQTPQEKLTPESDTARELAERLVSATPLSDHTGQIAGRVIHFQDLTELRSMETAMRRSERLAGIGRLAANIAHAIRNPLANPAASCGRQMHSSGMGRAHDK